MFHISDELKIIATVEADTSSGAQQRFRTSAQKLADSTKNNPAKIPVTFDYSRTDKNLSRTYSYIAKSQNLTKSLPAAALSAFQKQINDLETQSISALTSPTKEKVDALGNSVRAFKAELDIAGIKKNNVFDYLDSKVRGFASYLVGSTVVLNAVSKIQESFEIVKTLDQEIVNLQMVTGKSLQQTTDLMLDYNALAQEMSATTAQVSSAATEWLRQGNTLEETNTLLTNGMILSKVGALESTEATQYLTSALKGYNVEVEKSIDVVDKLSTVDMISATSTAGLAEAMSRTANSANIAGVSMDKLLGYLAVVGEVTQRSMESVGESFKTIFARMGNIRAGELIDPESAESLSDVENVLLGVGIKLRESSGEFRNFGTILDEVAGNWDNYGTVQQRAIAKAFAGTRQQENFLVLMENYDDALKYTEASMNSSGSAMEKFQYYEEGIEGRTNRLVASFEKLSTTLIDDSAIKLVIESINGLVKVFTLADGALAKFLITAATLPTVLNFFSGMKNRAYDLLPTKVPYSGKIIQLF